MARRISQRELRNDSGRVLRALSEGKSFNVTRNGVAVGELIPIGQRRFVRAEVALASFSGAPPLSRNRFQRNVDARLNQDPTRRA